jgi:DNA-binding protein H-NS
MENIRMSKVNLDKMSYRELLELRDDLAKAIVARKDAEKAEVKAKLIALASESGFDVADLLGARRGRKASAPGDAKYRNPKDASQTWTGRGRKPNWLVDAVSKGQKLESFLVA